MGIKIFKVTDDSFAKYGKIIDGYDFSKLLKAMEHTPLTDDVIYVPSVEALEECEVAKDLKMRLFGELPIQIGYCNGHNTKLNALEYHRSSEVNIAVTDMILLLGQEKDIREDFTYDTSNVEAFLVPAGTAVELYATSLHYAPCQTGDGGFKAVVVLPQGTNTELLICHTKMYDDKLLAAKNKWLIAHEEAGIEGAFCGLVGENIDMKE